MEKDFFESLASVFTEGLSERIEKAKQLDTKRSAYTLSFLDSYNGKLGLWRLFYKVAHSKYDSYYDTTSVVFERTWLSKKLGIWYGIGLEFKGDIRA